MWASAARRACMPAAIDAITAVIVVPMFCPMASAAACSRPNPGMCISKSISVMAIVAADACTSMVTKAPTMTNRMMVKKPPSATFANNAATIEPISRSFAACCRKLKPMKRNAKP